MRKSEHAHVSEADRGRVLARTLAEDLRRVQGGDIQVTLASTFTETAPPPGRDITNLGADGDLY